MSNQATPNATASAAEGKAERDDKGRFVKGNRLGRGNPFACRVAALRKTFLATVSKAEMQQICRRLVAQAMLGDIAAAKLVLGYVLGKFPEPVNPDTLYQEECRMYLENPSCADAQEVAQRRPPAELTAGLMRAMHIAHAAQARQQFQESSTKPPETNPDEESDACVEDLPEADLPAPSPTEPAAAGEAQGRPSVERTPSANGRGGRNELNAGLAPWSLDFLRPSGNGRNGQQRRG